MCTVMDPLYEPLPHNLSPSSSISTTTMTNYPFGLSSSSSTTACCPSNSISNDSLTENDFDLLLQTLNDSNTPSSKRRRRVLFNPEVSYSTSTSPLQFEELHELWYSSNDFASFKAETKRQVLTRQNCEVAMPQTENIYDENNNHENVNETNRGLEGYTYERQRQKHGAVRYIVWFYHNYVRQFHKSSDDLAILANKLGSKSRKRALVQGIRDYGYLYQPSVVQRIARVEHMAFQSYKSSSSSSKTLETVSTNNNKKRKFVSDDMRSSSQNQLDVRIHQRCVRRRLA